MNFSADIEREHVKLYKQLKY